MLRLPFIRRFLGRDDAPAPSGQAVPTLPTLAQMVALRDKLPHLDPMDDAEKARAAARLRAYYGEHR